MRPPGQLESLVVSVESFPLPPHVLLEERCAGLDEVAAWTAFMRPRVVVRKG